MSVGKINPNEPNKRLYKHWEKVFRKIPGFEDCICLRRVRCPNGGKDMDFFLLSQKPKPKIGLVECEGVSHKVPVGVEQLLTYVHLFSQCKGDGETILKVSLEDAFDTSKKRGIINEDPHSTLRKWFKEARPRIKDERHLARLLAKASKNLIPIVPYYREDGLEESEYKLLRLAFKKHRLFLGAVHPRKLKLLEGRYLLRGQC